MDRTLPSGSPAAVVIPPSARRGVVIVPDIGGLRPLFTDLAAHLAESHGWAVGCFEPWPGREHLTIEERLDAVATLHDERLLGDVVATGELLGVEPVAVIGFCMGGMVALKAAGAGVVDRAVSFYGMVRLPPHWVSDTMGEPLDALGAEVPVPVLSIVGTEDPWVPAVDAAALEERGAEVVRYAGADHGFVHDPSRPAHRPDDAADAWARVAAFLAVGG